MRKLALLVLAIFTVILAIPACGKSSPDQIQVKANNAFTLPVGKTAVLKDANFSLKFDSVTADSRCPTGVTCIWAGEAKCKMLVTQNGQTQELVLTQSGASDNNVQALNGASGNFQISFQLNPYPKAGSQLSPQDYVLSMKIY